MLDQNFRLCLREICFYLRRSWNEIFVIVKTIVFRIDGSRFVFFFLHFKHVAFVFCSDPLTFDLERLLSCVKIALTANRVYFEPYPEVFISFMIRGSGEGVLRRKKLLTPSICGHKQYISGL